MKPATTDIAVSIRNLHFRRGARVIFNGVDLEIPHGKVTALMGPSGCGKTTLLKMISGQLQPESGSVEVFGKQVPELRRDDLYELRKRMGMLFQHGALLTDLDVYDNIAFPLREHTQLSETLIRHIVLMKLELVGLRGARSLMPEELSGGMARRVALARGIALDPDMIMYDEPFVGLDPISMGVIVRLVRLLNDALGLTSVVVSHDVHDVLSIADYCCIVANGGVMGAGTPEELANSESAWVRQFISGDADGPVPFHYPAAGLRQDILEHFEERRGG